MLSSVDVEHFAIFGGVKNLYLVELWLQNADVEVSLWFQIPTFLNRKQNIWTLSQPRTKWELCHIESQCNWIAVFLLWKHRSLIREIWQWNQSRWHGNIIFKQINRWYSHMNWLFAFEQLHCQVELLNRNNWEWKWNLWYFVVWFWLWFCLPMQIKVRIRINLWPNPNWLNSSLIIKICELHFSPKFWFCNQVNNYIKNIFLDTRDPRKAKAESL